MFYSENTSVQRSITENKIKHSALKCKRVPLGTAGVHGSDMFVLGAATSGNDCKPSAGVDTCLRMRENLHILF